MAQLKRVILYLIVVSFFLSACKRDPFAPSHGSADFSKFISIGDSQTAGFANNGLYNISIMASFPSVMALQMKALGGGGFDQPLFNSGQENGSGYLQFGGYSSTGSPITTPVTTDLAIRGVVTIPGYGNPTMYTKYTGNNNNFGIIGIKLADLNNAQLGNTNGYFERLLAGSSPNNTTTYYNYLSTQSYTFFSCWIGNNDALAFATAGGASDSLTSKNNFNYLYSTLINKLTANKQKGVVATIPDVTAIPYFNTVTVDSISKVIRAANPSFQGLYINALTGVDLTTGYASRVATNDDLFILTFDASQIGKSVSTTAGSLPYGLTPLTPIDNKYVLDKNEVALVRSYVTGYNNSITTIAQSKGLAVFDAYSFLNSLKQGIVVNGIKLNAAFITGGVFSLDGVHLTPRGYALLANQFDAAINTKYGSALLPVDVSKYPAVLK